MYHQAVAISAPGKVLLAGGYLILDRDYTGLVFGLDARIHVHVQQALPTTSRPGSIVPDVVVRSPQFRDAEWRYGCQEIEEDGGVEVTQLLEGKSVSAQSSNKFVETALAYALTYISALTHSKVEPMSITIVADTDYYSCEGIASSSAARERFQNFNVPLSQAHKTGLGSSAALATAFVAAILARYLNPELFSLELDAGQGIIHNLAQAAHCAAQGKIGSGFDVAAAVYGSCVYKRFSPSILEGLGGIGTKGFSNRLVATIGSNGSSRDWDTQIQKSSAVLPKDIRLVMCDVDCGSETVGLVKKVLSWREKNYEEALLLWTTLQKGNEDLAGELQRLAQKNDKQHSDHQDLSDIILTIRSLIRELSTKAEVPIEPQVQTDLLDACYEVPGVIGGVVPGAGGFDAIVLLVEERDDVFECLHHLLKTYRADPSSGTDASIGRVKMLGVKQEMQGIKTEDPRIYHEWIK